MDSHTDVHSTVSDSASSLVSDGSSGKPEDKFLKIGKPQRRKDYVIVINPKREPMSIIWKPTGPRGVRVHGLKELSEASRHHWFSNYSKIQVPGCKMPQRGFWLKGWPFKPSREPNRVMRTCYRGTTFYSILFIGLDLKKFDFTGCIFISCNFHRCNLKFAEFDNSYFHRTTFSQSLIEIATFTDCTFVHSGFTSQYLGCVNFSGSTMEDCKFSGCIIQNSLFKRVKHTRVKFLDWVKIWNSEFRDCQFYGGRIESPSILTSFFWNTSFESFYFALTIDFQDTYFVGADFNSTVFDADGRISGCEFNGATFYRCDMRDIWFAKSDFTCSKWDFSTLSSVTFDNCRFGGSHWISMIFYSCVKKEEDRPEWWIASSEDLTSDWILPEYLIYEFIDDDSPPHYEEDETFGSPDSLN